jgi:hypothetical protein
LIGANCFLHPFDFLLLSLDLYLVLNDYLIFLFALEDASRFPELVVESIDDIIDELACFLLVHFGLLCVQLWEFKIEGEKFSAFIVGLLADVEFEEFAFDWLLLVDGVEV